MSIDTINAGGDLRSFYRFLTKTNVQSSIQKTLTTNQNMKYENVMISEIPEILM